MNVFDILSMVDCFKIFIIPRSTEILIESNFRLEVYAKSIFKLHEIFF